MNIAIKSRENKLYSFINRAKQDDVPDDVRAELLRHGAILICGHIEQCVKLVIMDRLQNRAHPKIINFVKSYFEFGKNLDCNAIVSLLERFDIKWGKLFKKFIDENEDIREGISSAYSIRNPLAHGSTASLGHARLTELFEISKRLTTGLIKATAN